MTEPIWLSVARMSVGLREVPGPQNDPVVMRWAKDIGAPDWFDNDDKAWCAIFPNRVMLACHLPMAGTSFELVRAKSFQTWGVPLTAPRLGAVLVFSRPDGAHVGFYLGERVDAYRVLGGNQRNAVTDDTWIAKTRLMAIRWPLGVPVPVDAAPVVMQADGSAVSNNEA